MLRLLEELERINSQYQRNPFQLVYNGDAGFIGVCGGEQRIHQCTGVVCRDTDSGYADSERHRHLDLLCRPLSAAHNTRQFFDLYAGEGQKDA